MIDDEPHILRALRINLSVRAMKSQPPQPAPLRCAPPPNTARMW
ncbi:hypothetical protein I552_1547 [Mycobacterium xenopi 3993]|nr:hypothetical protein I552_1547 [Mycobacterium xenopi 3993]